MEDRGRKRMLDKKYGGKKGIQLRAYFPEYGNKSARLEYKDKQLLKNKEYDIL